jgi:hypothetical protein
MVSRNDFVALLLTAGLTFTKNFPLRFTGATTVSNSTITGICQTADCYNQGFWVDQCRTSTLRDSVITIIGGNGNAISAANELNVFNSQIYTNASPGATFSLMSYWGGGSATIANSLLQADMAGIIGASDIVLFNNFDGKRPIPNQPQ